MTNQEKLIEMVEDFCDEYLNDEYKQVSGKIVEKMANKSNIYFKKAKLKIWASAIIYAISQIYSLFEESNEVHITRKDICNYFNTSQPIVSRKAIYLRDTFDLDNELSLSDTQESDILEWDDIDNTEEIIHDNIMEYDFDEYSSMLDDENMTIEDYQSLINAFKRKFGKKFFKENEGKFWLIHETRPFMQCVFNQAQLFWINGEKEKAINQYKYLLKLNPNDNQGVRDSLLPNLLELNRLDEAQKLYLQYEDDSSANWKFGKLLLDIKKNVNINRLKIQYKECIETNPHVVPFLLGKKTFPDEMPYFYGVGDENEAIFTVVLSASAWWDDKKAMSVLKKLSKK